MLAKVHQAFAALIAKEGGRVTLRLEPGTLGRMQVRLHVDTGRVSAEFRVHTEQARQLLSENLTGLRSALEAHGLVVDGLQVATDLRALGTDAPREDESPDGAGDHADGAADGNSSPASHDGGQGGAPEDRAQARPGAVLLSAPRMGAEGGVPIWSMGLDAIA